MQLQLYQVRYFLALARTLNFTRAAEQCNVTQPALTKAVQKLEQELGGTLIHRERHLTQLTELGKMILPTLEKIFAAAEAVRLQAQGYQKKTIAPLKIGLVPSKDNAAAQAYEDSSAAKANARVRRVRIRDYGKYDRREAPQYYVDAKGAETIHG
jgi:DNA-binding MarR family transcriptional regulator